MAIASNCNKNQKLKSPIIKEGNQIENPKGYHNWSRSALMFTTKLKSKKNYNK